MQQIIKIIFKNTIYSIFKKENHNQKREIIWTIVPIIILILIAIPSIKLLYLVDGSNWLPKVSFTYRVIGNQWYWTYYYESFCNKKCIESFLVDENMFVINGELRLLEVTEVLYVPVYVNLRFLVTSIDVIHSWAVPSLGIKIDCIPGRLNQVVTVINRVGDFYGQCSEICGINHGFMPIHLVSFKI